LDGHAIGQVNGLRPLRLHHSGKHAVILEEAADIIHQNLRLIPISGHQQDVRPLPRRQPIPIIPKTCQKNRHHRCYETFSAPPPGHYPGFPVFFPLRENSPCAFPVKRPFPARDRQTKKALQENQPSPPRGQVFKIFSQQIFIVDGLYDIYMHP